ncbi:MAG: type IV pilus secretin PilQ [Pseudomonadota bacterium]
MNATRSKHTQGPRWAGILALASWLAAGNVLADPNQLSTVTVSNGQNESQVVRITLKDPVADLPVAFTTSNPHRLVLDFANTSAAAGRLQERANQGVVRDYQVIQSGERTRVVINLNGPASHELRKDKNQILAVLQGAQKTAGGAAPTRFAEADGKRDHALRDLDFRRGNNGEGRIAVTLSDPGVGIDIQQKGRAIQVDFMNTALPSALRRRLDVADFGTAAQLVEAFENEKNTRLLITPRGKWDYSAYQTGNQFILEVRSLDDPRQAKSDQPVYTGEKLTLNFQNVEVRSVLQVIADFTGLNIIASDTVTGNVTLRLKDVPWDQALDIIMRAKGLDKRATGNVIWVAPRDELVAKEKLELEAKKSITDLEPLVTRSYSLNYIRADEALAVISGLSRSLSSSSETATCTPSATGIKAEATTGSTTSGQSGAATSNVNRVLSPRGGASHDLTTNTLVVTDTPEKHASVEDVLKTVDIPSKQIMIEARIVLADDTFSRDLGARLDVRFKGAIDGSQVGVGGDINSSIDMINAAKGVLPENVVNVNLPSAVTAPSIGFTIVSAASNFLLGLELQALEADNRGKIVSNPRVVTTNLRPAVILQGTQIPYSTRSGSDSSLATTTSFKDALLCLLVSPQVLNNDSVILNVEVTKDALGAETFSAGPPINVKRVKTQVRVNNGETAILGGIFEQTIRNDTSKVPLLGDIPVLGNLFKSNSKTDEKSEMLIFLTPRILDEQLSAFR